MPRAAIHPIRQGPRGSEVSARTVFTAAYAPTVTTTATNRAIADDRHGPVHADHG